jgi:hypothetical protein
LPKRSSTLLKSSTTMGKRFHNVLWRPAH